MSKDAIVCKGGIMILEYILGLVVSLFILVYLLIALLWPERF
jgi:K+-transporting ATPase KdpF subunit